jgi:hypothetical protein
MNNCANVGLVDTKPECRGGDHKIEAISSPTVNYSLAIFTTGLTRKDRGTQKATLTKDHEQVVRIFNTSRVHERRTRQSMECVDDLLCSLRRVGGADRDEIVFLPECSSVNVSEDVAFFRVPGTKPFDRGRGRGGGEKHCDDGWIDSDKVMSKACKTL